MSAIFTQNCPVFGIRPVMKEPFKGSVSSYQTWQILAPSKGPTCISLGIAKRRCSVKAVPEVLGDEILSS